MQEKAGKPSKWAAIQVATKPVLSPTIHLGNVNLYTKYEFLILYGCSNIFDEKRREKNKKQTNKYREELTGFQNYKTGSGQESKYEVFCNKPHKSSRHDKPDSPV